MAYDNGITAVQALMNGQVDQAITTTARSGVCGCQRRIDHPETPWVEEQYSSVSTRQHRPAGCRERRLNGRIADGTVQSIIDSYITAE